MQTITETKQTSLDKLAKKRREILARAYSIILSPDWGITDGGQSAFASETHQAKTAYQEISETGVGHDAYTN